MKREPSTVRTAPESADRPKRKRVPGVGGRNTKAGFMLREEREGQIDAWRAAAAQAGESLSGWIRKTLDAAAERFR
jgi:hypothetical protein